MTNYESIKAMGMNELAGFLASITTCFDCPARNCGGHEVCTAALLEWLNAESDDDTLDDYLLQMSRKRKLHCTKL